MIVIDPKRTQAADLADIWLAPRVGTDAALALAMIHVLKTEELYDKAFVAQCNSGLSDAWLWSTLAGRRRHSVVASRAISGAHMV
jgi:anaerobic selenocysteine-containing dehydrogenase